MSRTPSITKFPCSQDAIRIQAQGKGDAEGQSRRFSVDPQLTNFDILRNIVGRAFDIKGDFAVSYRALDDFGGETFLPMVSDWDLSAAFVSASDPDLQLMIEPNNIAVHFTDESGSVDEEAWELIRSTEVIPASPVTNNHNRNNRNKPNQSTNLIGSSGQPQEDRNGSTAVTSQTYNPINFNAKLNPAGFFNTMERWVQKAKTFVEDISVVTTRPPLSDVEFRHYLDAAGVLCRPKELRFACYHGGIEPSLRKVVWKHLLNVYPGGLTGNGRMEYIRNKAKDYYDLRDVWKNSVQNGLVNDEIMCVSNMVRKDVLRTDRHLKYFAGHDDNQNIANLFNILTTYALNHQSVGYCQGMSDLASPLLVTMGDEAQAYICFCSLMDRLKPNFSSDGVAMSMKFAHLAEALAYYDNIFWRYLKSIGADDLLFCYRWLLLEMKREFAFDDALRMMEVLWASLPYKPQDVPLYETKFTGIISQSNPIPVPTLTSSYSKVCAIRRSSTASHSLDLRHRRVSARKQKASPHLSLDENSLTSLSSVATSSASQSSHRKPYYSMDETIEILTSRDFLSSSPFEILSIRDASPKPTKMVKNLKEFWQINPVKARNGTGNSHSSHSSESSTVSNTGGKSHSADADTDINLHESVFTDEDEDDDDEENEKAHKIDNFVFPKARKFSKHNSLNLQRSSSLHCNQNQNQIQNQNNSESPCSKGDDSNKANNKFIELGSKPNMDSTSNILVTVAPGENTTIKNNTSTTTQSTNPTIAKATTVMSTTNGNNNLGIPEHQVVSGDCCNDSENDSGHCCSESYELDESSLEEPEFQDKCRPPNKLPPPGEFGGGNSFLMFLSLTLLLQHRDHILRNQLDYNETAMYFDKLVRKHNVARVLSHARQMHANYLKQSVPRV